MQLLDNCGNSAMNVIIPATVGYISIELNRYIWLSLKGGVKDIGGGEIYNIQSVSTGSEWPRNSSRDNLALGGRTSFGNFKEGNRSKLFS